MKLLRETTLRPMTEDETKVFTYFLMMAVADDRDKLVPARDLLTEIEAMFGPASKDFFLQVLAKRLEAHAPDLTFSPLTTVFTASLCRNPAVAVMWAYQLFEQSRDGTPLTFMRFGEVVFGDGVPTESGYEECWDSQKEAGAPLGNLLDSMETWALKTIVVGQD